LEPRRAGTALTVTIAQLGAVSRTEFVAALGDVFERSPWVAEGAFDRRPFASVEALHAAMTRVVRDAPRDAQLALLRAHPDLAGRAARAGAMTAASVAEQASAGLDRLGDEEYERFTRLNAAYRERFGFPFVIAVRRQTKAGILAAFERRLAQSLDREIETALDEVSEIARLRLLDRIQG
jgi:2-oxo-4-hydroxy-4-carboxy-5-ureidoimidazoline decarboxylase